MEIVRKKMSYKNKHNGDGIISKMEYDTLSIYDLLYKYEHINGFGIAIEYNYITRTEHIIIEVFSNYIDIINELLALNCFYPSGEKYIYYEDVERRIYQFHLPWMVDFFDSFKDEYQIYRRKRNIEKL